MHGDPQQSELLRVAYPSGNGSTSELINILGKRRARVRDECSRNCFEIRLNVQAKNLAETTLILRRHAFQDVRHESKWLHGSPFGLACWS